MANSKLILQPITNTTYIDIRNEESEENLQSYTLYALTTGGKSW